MKRAGTILTAEERKVLILSARRLTNREIAERLGMSVVNVKTVIHRASIKLGARNRYQAAFIAITQGYITLDEIWLPAELADYLVGLSPDSLSNIAQVIWQRGGNIILPMLDKGVLHIDKRRENILTNRERDVLVLVGQTLTNKEIAEKLRLSEFAVRKMLQKACSKLGTRSRACAFMLALKRRDIGLAEVISLDNILRSLAQLKLESLEEIAQLLDKKFDQEYIRIADTRALAR